MNTAHHDMLARRIRASILRCTTTAGSGHPTSSLSAVEFMTWLFFSYFHADVKNPANPNNDHIIFSKGHASPLFYSLYEAAGVITAETLLTYRQFDSVLEGHPTPRFPLTEVASGSLGQGLAVGVGEALAIQRRFAPQKKQVNDDATETSFDAQKDMTALPRVYVLMGDGEMAEGSVWEAAALASHFNINNLVAIIDVNRLGQTQETMHGYDTNAYRRKWEAFGWGAIVIDGHNYSEIDAAYQKALNYKAGPTVIIAKTVKGKGVPAIENIDGWHGKVLSTAECDAAITALGPIDESVRGVIQEPLAMRMEESDVSEIKPEAITYRSDEKVATRKAFGHALSSLVGTYPQLIVLDGDVKNSTYTDMVLKNSPDRFIEVFIAEQTMVGVAMGMAKLGHDPWVSSFGCFLTRAYDQIRMAALSGLTIRFNGSHAGVATGEDGTSQMALEDISMFRSIFGSTVVCPADGYAAEALTTALMQVKGISYIRTTREATPILYSEKDHFVIGGSKVRPATQRGTKEITIIATGITVHEAIAAQKQLTKNGIAVRVIDCYSIKPIDTHALKQAAAETQAIIIVEDHYAEGGLGEAVTIALANTMHPPIYHLAVTSIPRSGKPQELLSHEGIDAEGIIAKVKELFT